MRSAEIIMVIECELDDILFGPWEELTKEEQSVFDYHHTNCDGSGAMGTWCRDCHFCALMQDELIVIE